MAQSQSRLETTANGDGRERPARLAVMIAWLRRIGFHSITPSPAPRSLSAIYRPSRTPTPGRWTSNPAAASGADLLLVSVVAAARIEHVGEHSGPRRGAQQRARADSISAQATQPSSVTFLRFGHVERRLEASSSPARGLHDSRRGGAGRTDCRRLLAPRATRPGAVGFSRLAAGGRSPGAALRLLMVIEPPAAAPRRVLTAA